MRNRFDQQLELLNKQLIHMGESTLFPNDPVIHAYFSAIIFSS